VRKKGEVECPGGDKDQKKAQHVPRRREKDCRVQIKVTLSLEKEETVEKEGTEGREERVPCEKHDKQRNVGGEGKRSEQGTERKVNDSRSNGNKEQQRQAKPI